MQDGSPRVCKVRYQSLDKCNGNVDLGFGSCRSLDEKMWSSKLFYVTYLIQLHTTGIDYDCTGSEYCRDRSLFVARGGKGTVRATIYFLFFIGTLNGLQFFSGKRPFDSGLSQSKKRIARKISFLLAKALKSYQSWEKKQRIKGVSEEDWFCA